MKTNFWFFGRQFREEDPDGQGRSTSEINDQGNRRRVDRLAEIANHADGNRAKDLSDVEGERVQGRFQGGELDESPEARERAAEEEEARASQALEDQREEAEREDREEARRLQSEGASEGTDEGDPEHGTQGGADEGDERVINGIKHFAVAIGGQIQWLTLKQLREDRSKAGDVDKALQAAQAALQGAAAASLRPQPAEAYVELDEEDIRNVLTAAVLGDSEAIERLVPIIARRGGVDPNQVGQEVSRRLATQRAIDEGEKGQKDLMDHPVLAGVFKQRFNALKEEKPTTTITAAYKEVGDGIRKDFGAMLGASKENPGNGHKPPPPDKAARKRSYVGPPSAASRQPAQPDPDREVPVSDTIDSIARSRGQSRAIRQSRR